jgi:hypothetical protein
VIQKMMDALDKIESKAFDLLSDFGSEIQVVRKSGETKATKALEALEALEARLAQQLNAIADTNRACRLALKNSLQPLGTNPQAQEVLRRLHV